MTHTMPMPQPPFPLSDFKSVKYGTNKPILVPNPALFMLNDITIGFSNADVIKDLCMNMVVKQPNPSSLAANGAPRQTKQKIDRCFEGILQQRSMYPVYPNNMFVPMDWEQYKGLMFEQAPDILITPSNLNFVAKNIDGCICVNPKSVICENSGGSFANIYVDSLVLPAEAEFADESKKFSNRASDRIRVEIKNI